MGAQSLMLTDERERVLSLLFRYRVLTLRHLCILLGDSSLDAVRMRCERLVHHKWLRKRLIEGNEVCYALGSRAERQFRIHWHGGTTFPFANHGLLQHLGIAEFCATLGFERMLPEEFATRCPGCHRPCLPAQNYCLEREEPGAVVWPLVDHNSKPSGFYAKVGRVISKRLVVPEFGDLLRTDKFGVVVITGVPEKRDRIEEDLRARTPIAAPISVLCMPIIRQFWL
jgi:hypothetical protein